MENRLTKDFKLINVFLVIFIFVCEILSAEVPRPRGVSLSRAPLYPPIRTLHVNDDYCDCADASDEPGTSACPNGMFHCTNAGHRPLNIASNRVNDGICDCCDGSDEYVSGRSCENNCIEQGRSAREEAQKKAELVKAGKELRAELSQKGLQMKQEKQSMLGELEKNKEEASKMRAEKLALKLEVEEEEKTALSYYRQLEEEQKKKKAEEEEVKSRAEAEETFNRFDSNRDGLLDVSELQARQNFDKDRNGEGRGEVLLNGQTSVDLETFLQNCWRDVKLYLMKDEGAYQPPATETEDANGEVEEVQEDEHDEEAHEEEDEEEEEESEPPQPEEEQPEEEHPEDKFTVEYDEDTKKIVERATAARNAFYEADKQARELEGEIKAIRDYLEKDFGPEEEFATLQGQCFDYQDHEYIYKLCPFDKTSQTPKSSSAETRLGVWGRWGDNEEKYDTMYYEGGQQCWNGPQRSTRVKLECGSENKVTSVSEPNRCEYFFEFFTPAACREAQPDVRDELHDEL
ncbi:hypothetical protein NQ317_005012 [Molorchus minor]|uniref:Glucosidase 2 subunit beta n=1 Tax=Molorchus minor TaxID=1323400 RepID=A0ABQ9K3U6_9CUCU|nr:hypothetical protein NQ317_005012 [Molorchus minor]